MTKALGAARVRGSFCLQAQRPSILFRSVWIALPLVPEGTLEIGMDGNPNQPGCFRHFQRPGWAEPLALAAIRNRERRAGQLPGNLATEPLSDPEQRRSQNEHPQYGKEKSHPERGTRPAPVAGVGCLPWSRGNRDTSHLIGRFTAAAAAVGKDRPGGNLDQDGGTPLQSAI